MTQQTFETLDQPDAWLHPGSRRQTGAALSQIERG